MIFMYGCAQECIYDCDKDNEDELLEEDIEDNHCV